MSNFSFKGDTLTGILHPGDRLTHPPDSLRRDTILQALPENRQWCRKSLNERLK